MPPRELFGWSPSTVTVDTNGDLVSVSVAEPRFSATDVALLIQARRDRDTPRNALGISFREASDPANDPSSRKATGRFVVPAPAVDFAQTAVDAAIAAHKKTYPDDKRALLWRVEHEQVGD